MEALMAHRSATVLGMILFGATFALACGGSDDSPPLNDATTGAGGSGTGVSGTGGTGASSGSTGKGGTGASSGSTGKGGSAGTGGTGTGGSAGAGTGGSGGTSTGGSGGTGTGGTGTGGTGTGGTGTGGTGIGGTGTGGTGTGGTGTGGTGTGGTGTGGTGTGGTGTGGTGGSTGCGMAWEATYAMTGTFYITDTTLGLGDTNKPIGTGSIKLRFDDVGGKPGGKARIISYSMPMNFVVTTVNVTVDTMVTATVPENACGHATGMVSGTNINWDACTYGSTWNTGPGKWVGDANAASGVGCLNDYNSKGNVKCTQSAGLGSCSQGKLNQGDNLQDGTWAQPLNGFELSADFTTFKMNMLNAPSQTASKYKDKGVETPNAQPSRTWFRIDATGGTPTMVAKDCSCN
jgi:hypothetical protein